MNKIKIASFNAEWMVSIFNGDWKQWDKTIHDSFPGKYLGEIKLEPINNIHDLCSRISNTIKKVDADIIGIQEGPPLKSQMDLFIKTYLDNQYVSFKSNSRWQTIYALVKKNLSSKVSVLSVDKKSNKNFWDDIPYYPWGKFKIEQKKLHDCHRRPLILKYSPDSNKTLEIIILHTKSKYSKLKTQQQWETRDRSAVFDALISRQKLSAEISRLREYLEERITSSNSNDSLVIIGDFNDGPLSEDLEKEFLIHNIIDEIVGSVTKPHVYIKHAMNEEILLTSWTTEFKNPFQNDTITKELIDHIFISPSIWNKNSDFELIDGSCVIESDAYNSNFDSKNGNNDRQYRPSDHRPISAMFTF